jgi:thioredoxin reductase (NADPH)
MSGGKPKVIYVYNAVVPKDRELLPLLEELEKQGDVALGVVRVDIYKSNGLARRLGIAETPCVLVLREGRKVKVFSREAVCLEGILDCLR